MPLPPGSPRPVKRWLLAAAGLAAIAAALPVLARQAPESLLPPGFGQPAAPPPQPQPQPQPQPAPSDQPPPTGSLELPSYGLATPPEEGVAVENASDADIAVAAAQAAAAAEALRKQDLPDWARGALDLAGVLGPAEGGMDADAFGGARGANGRYLAGLMRRDDAPIASRWASILLRRALLSRVPTPRAIGGADWIAERAWLLVRMGEADAAAMLIRQVPSDSYTPRLYAVAMQAALASADPGALCPIADQAATVSAEKGWTLARAICAALSGDAGTSSALIDQARGRGSGRAIDLLLAQRLAGAANNSRRSTVIEWGGVNQLTSWRFGMASAVGLVVPDRLYATVGPRVRAWEARAPMLPLGPRVAAARTAAILGVFSSATLVDVYGALFDAGDANAGDTPSAHLRDAYAARDDDARLTALRALWADPADASDRYAATILTARAAALVAPDAGRRDDAARLIDAMLSAGLDSQAARWAPVVAGLGGRKGDEAWALLALGAPAPVMAIAADRVAGFGARDGSDQRKRAQLLFAGLAGLGRLAESDRAALAGRLGVPIGAANGWTRAIDAAATHGQPGTVAVLAAIGLQSADWNGIPAFQLYHIVAALSATGHAAEARMIAAEAISRT